MSKNYNDISYIESYLKGEMDRVEQQAFEAQLADDEIMRSEVDAYQQIMTGFEGLREESFAKDVAQWIVEAKSENKGNIVSIQPETKLRPMWRRFAVAASVALLLGFGAAWWGGSQYSDEAIAERNYISPLSSGTMGDAPQLDEIEELYEAAHKNFRLGEYAAASSQFDSFLLNLENNPSLFDELTMKSYVANANWTKLLALFAGGEIEEAEMKSELEKIAGDPNSEYADEAKRMLGELDSFWRIF